MSTSLRSSTGLWTRALACCACVLWLASTSTHAANTALDAAASKLAPGAWIELKTQGYDYQSLMRGEDILAYCGKAAYDAKNKQVHFIGQVHLKGPPVHICYDLASNTWKQLPTSEWSKPLKWFHAYENNAADSTGGYFYHNPSASGNIHRYDAAKAEWTSLPVLKARHGHGMALVYYPERKSLLRYLGSEVWEYSETSGKWSKLASEAKAGPYHNMACYSAVHKCVLLGGGNGSPHVYRVGVDGKLAACKPAPFNLGVGMSLTVCDPASGEMIAVSKEGKAAAFNAGQNAWTDLPDAPFKAGHGVSAAPIYGSNVLLYFGGRTRGMKVWLYKHKPLKPAASK